MKIIVNSTVLLTALQYVSKVISNKSHVPIIENFLFSVRNNVLTVSGTDLQSTFKLSWPIEANKGTEFQAVVPKEIVKYLLKLDEQPLTLSYHAESYSIEVMEMDGHAKYSGENPEDFPHCPQTNTELFETSSDMFIEFKDLLNYVSADELRPAMTGIYFGSYLGAFQMTATDGHKLKVVGMPELDTVESKFILPAKPAQILSSLKFGTGKKYERAGVTVCAGYKEQVADDKTITQTLTNVSFLFTLSVFDMELTTRIIDERYPQYWNVIPTKSTTQYTTDKKKFLKVLDKANLFAHKTTHQVKLSLNGTNKISAEDLDFSNEYCGEVGGTYEGEPIEIGFNAELLKETVNSFGDTFTLEMVAPNKAAVIRQGNTLALCMPVMLGQYK